MIVSSVAFAHERIDLSVVISGQEPFVTRMQRRPLVLSGGVVFNPFYIHLHVKHHQLAREIVPTLKRLKQDVQTTLCNQEILERRLSAAAASSGS